MSYETADVLRRLAARMSTRLNNHLCEMQEGYDDSVVGFNEAWEIASATIKEAIEAEEAAP